MKRLLSCLSCILLFICCAENEPQSSIEQFAQNARVQVKGKAGNFRGGNTLAGWHSVASPNLCMLLPMQILSIPYAQDTSQEKIKKILKNTERIYFFSYSNNDEYLKVINTSNKDTILGQLIFSGEDVIRKTCANCVYTLGIFGEGTFNSTLRTFNKDKYDYDTIAYIPNRVTARFYLIIKRLFSEAKYDSCNYYMYNMIKFFPLDNSKQYRDLITSGAEPIFKDTTEMRQYLELVKREDGKDYPF